MATKTKEMILARRAANNARIEAGNARAGKTIGQIAGANSNARASMQRVRGRVAAQKAATPMVKQNMNIATRPAGGSPMGRMNTNTAVAAPKPAARRAAPKKAVVAPISSVAPAPAQNMSSEIMSREVPNRKMVDRVYGLKTAPVRKSSWNWSV